MVNKIELIIRRVNPDMEIIQRRTPADVDRFTSLLHEMSSEKASTDESNEKRGEVEVSLLILRKIILLKRLNCIH